MFPNNPHLILLNLPQILKTRVRVKFWEIADWPIRFLIDPPLNFRKQIKNEGPISGFHPLILKTIVNPGCFLLGSVF